MPSPIIGGIIFAGLGAVYFIYRAIRKRYKGKQKLSPEAKAKRGPRVQLCHKYIANAQKPRNKEETIAVIQKTINNLISDAHSFKIGKTANPRARANNEDYASTYKTMHVLYKSASSDKIDKLEAHFLAQYLKNPKIRNKRGGSAGEMNDKHEFFYLYLIRK